MASEPVLTPTDFVAITNQVLEVSMPHVFIEGELTNYKVSKNKWLYLDLKDDQAKVSCFGSIYILPGPLEEGMKVKVGGRPYLHPQYGFSINIQTIQPSGEGSIKKAFEMLKEKLKNEGLFDEDRKRSLPFPPKNISLITSKESAAYADFIKIVENRWPYLQINLYDVQVQGEDAVNQIVKAVTAANNSPSMSDLIVMIRGGGSLDDLSAFNDERVTRSIAASRLPTLVAIGHEVDLLLAEMVADLRASTPSHAAEVMVPSRGSELEGLVKTKHYINQLINNSFIEESSYLSLAKKTLVSGMNEKISSALNLIKNYKKIIEAYNPNEILRRGYSIVRQKGGVVGLAAKLDKNTNVQINMQDGGFEATIESINLNKIKIRKEFHK
ncbi:exodeoxyribonuclease VII large subunit [Candidatus Saccharibacteria bacterium]|nr:exodeoxyribonuclease VII large subunit [Candidatus Saccharibacteria bacterium]